MLLGRKCANPFPLYFAQYLHPVGLISLFSSFFFGLLLDLCLERRGGGDGERDVEGEGERLRGLRSFFLRRPLLLSEVSSLSVVVAAYALSAEELLSDLYCTDGWSRTSCWRRVMP